MTDDAAGVKELQSCPQAGPPISLNLALPQDTNSQREERQRGLLAAIFGTASLTLRVSMPPQDLLFQAQPREPAAALRFFRRLSGLRGC